jgi:general secretion pathway protein K
MKRILGNNRGVALILVLLMMSVIVAVTLQINVASRAQIYEVSNLGDGIKAIYIAKSGLFGAAMILANDKNAYDGLDEEWANLEPLTEKSKSLFDGGYLKLSIADESGKIQVNRLADGDRYNNEVKDLLTRLLSLPEYNLSARQVSELLDAIKDWLDPDSEVTGGGAENAFYASLPEPYACKNGPLDSLEELLRVRGMTRELFYGREDRPGIASCLTTEGSGRININTAPRQVLKALAPGITESAAEEMELFRKKEGDRLSDPLWYKNVAGMETVNINSNILSVRSEVFSVSSTGVIGTLSRTVGGMVERDGSGKIKILSWKVR